MSFIQSPGGVAVLVYLLTIVVLFAYHVRSKLRRAALEKQKRSGLPRQLVAGIDSYDPVVIDQVDPEASSATKLAVISRLEKETERRIKRLSKKIAACEAKLDPNNGTSAGKKPSVDTVMDNGKPPPLDFTKLRR